MIFQMLYLKSYFLLFFTVETASEIFSDISEISIFQKYFRLVVFWCAPIATSELQASILLGLAKLSTSHSTNINTNRNTSTTAHTRRTSAKAHARETSTKAHTLSG